MTEEEPITTIAPEELLEKVRTYRDTGFRLVQISCTKIEETFEITYCFDKDYRLDTLAVGGAVDETADPADPLGDVDVFGKLPLLDQGLEPAVDIADGGQDLLHLLVLDDQIEMDRFREHRVLRAEGHDYFF